MTQSGTVSGTVSGNHFCFTWNNYTEDDIKNLEKLDKKDIKYIIFGKEIGESGTQHLQGYVETVKKSRITGVKKILDKLLKEKSKIHIELTNAKNKLFAINYCKKGSQSKEEWNKLKDMGPNYGKDAIVYENRFLNIDEGKSYEDLFEDYPEEIIKYPSGIEKAIKSIKDKNTAKDLDDELNLIKPRKWQNNLLTELENTPDDRKIIWYFDKDGASGKSTLIDLCMKKFPKDVCILENAATKDIAEAYNGEKIVLFDLSRTIEGYFNYGAMESLKNKHTF